MIIRGGHTISVYRSTGRDRHGDITAAALQLVGTIDHVVFQWASASPVEGAAEVTSMSTVVFCPRDAAVKLRERDRIKFNNDNYVVVGGPSWDEVHPMSGTDFGYYMAKVMVMS